MSATSPDGASATLTVPFAQLGQTDLDGLHAHLERPWALGVLLVRRGGFAVAHVVGADTVEAKIGQRHVQGRSKAGGWSQQRFARRRDKQAREAFEAAAGHVRRILVPVASQLDLLVTGGDQPAVHAVLDDPALSSLVALPREWVTGVADPRRAVLDAVIDGVRSVRVKVVDPLPPPTST